MKLSDRLIASGIDEAADKYKQEEAKREARKRRLEEKKRALEDGEKVWVDEEEYDNLQQSPLPIGASYSTVGGSGGGGGGNSYVLQYNGPGGGGSTVPVGPTGHSAYPAFQHQITVNHGRRPSLEALEDEDDVPNVDKDIEEFESIKQSMIDKIKKVGSFFKRKNKVEDDDTLI